MASDILSAPVPSNVPSPALMPQTQRPPSSLIRFDSLASIQGVMYMNCLIFFYITLLEMTSSKHDLDVHQFLCNLLISFYDKVDVKQIFGYCI